MSGDEPTLSLKLVVSTSLARSTGPCCCLAQARRLDERREQPISPPAGHFASGSSRAGEIKDKAAATWSTTPALQTLPAPKPNNNKALASREPRVKPINTYDAVGEEQMY